MSKQCEGRVWPGGSMRSYQCRNTGKVERDGKCYCGIHDPEAKKIKAKARSDKWKAEHDARRELQLNAEKERDVRNAKAAMFDEMLQALKLAYQRMTDLDMQEHRLADLIEKAEGI